MKVVRRMLCASALAVAACCAATLMTSTEAQAQTVACGPCSGFFWLDGQICFYMSCNGGPCNILRCLDF